MNRLVGDLLDVVSLESGTLRIMATPGDARQLLTEAGEAFQPAFVAAGVTLTTDIGPGAMVVACDLVARLSFRWLHTEPPVGAVTALIGGPIFLVLLRRSDRLGV